MGNGEFPHETMQRRTRWMGLQDDRDINVPFPAKSHKEAGTLLRTGLVTQELALCRTGRSCHKANQVVQMNIHQKQCSLYVLGVCPTTTARFEA